MSGHVPPEWSVTIIRNRRSRSTEIRTPRERILGTGTRNTLDDLARALAARDKPQTGRWLGSAAVQVCARCHGVHRTLSDLRNQLFDLGQGGSSVDDVEGD